MNALFQEFLPSPLFKKEVCICIESTVRIVCTLKVCFGGRRIHNEHCPFGKEGLH